MGVQRYWLAILLLAGCYDPKLGAPGFFCHATDNPACPDGQTCVEGRCINTGSQITPADFAAAVDHGADSSTNESGDMRSGSTDLSSPPRDLSQSSCVATGGDCTYHKNSVCCSNYCVYSTNTCK
jgi:hypothetical protein